MVQETHLVHHEFVNARRAAFPSEATLLHTSKRRTRLRDSNSVDTNHPDLQFLCNLVRPRKVLGKEVRGKTDFTAVGSLDNIVLIVKLEQGCKGTESFFICDGTLSRYIREDCGFVEARPVAIVDSLPSNENLGTKVDGVLHMSFDFFHTSLRDERTDSNTFFHTVANLERLDSLDQSTSKVIINLGMDKDTVLK